ncbi:hypothetical protein ES708_20058 [subsurface metagenome]
MVLRYAQGSNAARIRSQVRQVFFDRGDYLLNGIHLINIILRAHSPGFHGSLVGVLCYCSNSCTCKIVRDPVGLLVV